MSASSPLPSAFDALPALTRGRHRPSVLLDYDGTLTPIVARPELAILDPAVRGILARLMDVADVAIVSGRDLDDVSALLDLPGVTVAGSHGFEVAYPDGHRLTFGEGESYLAALDTAAAAAE